MTVALPKPFFSAKADIFLIASAHSRPLYGPELISMPSCAVNGSGGSATVSSGSFEIGRMTRRISRLYFLANS